MYDSLVNFDDPFHMFLFIMDDYSQRMVESLHLRNTTVIETEKFENEILLEKKKERTKVEYCWTCSSSLMDYIFENYGVEELTYLDADLFFFRNPKVLFEEFHSSGKDVLLIEHNYSDKGTEKIELNGRYNLQFLTIKNSTKGRNTLEWWKERCLEWCFSIPEPGRFGDQKYLDYFEERFNSVHVLQNYGGGVAPWNIKQYAVTAADEGPLINGRPVVFYHFHNLKVCKGFFSYGCSYGTFSKEVLQLIYMPYIEHWEKCADRIMLFDSSFVYTYDKVFFDYNFLKYSVMQPMTEQAFVLAIKTIKNKRRALAIWGWGNNGRHLHELLGKYGVKVDLIIDRDENIRKINSEIKNPEALSETESFVIVTPVSAYECIEKQLEEMGYREGDDYMLLNVFYDYLHKQIVQKG